MKKLLAVLLLCTLITPAFAANDEKEADRVKDAGEVLSEILNIPDDIPQDLLDKAECLVILPSVKKGAFGIGGVVAFVFGSVMLFDAGAPGFGIAYSIIAAFAVSSLLLFMFVVGLALRARRRPIITGSDELIGAHGMALDDFAEQGPVRVHSERWRARSGTPIAKGQPIKVTGREGLILTVEPEQPTNKGES